MHEMTMPVEIKAVLRHTAYKDKNPPDMDMKRWKAKFRWKNVHPRMHVWTACIITYFDGTEELTEPMRITEYYMGYGGRRWKE